MYFLDYERFSESAFALCVCRHGPLYVLVRLAGLAVYAAAVIVHRVPKLIRNARAPWPAKRAKYTLIIIKFGPSTSPALRPC